MITLISRQKMNLTHSRWKSQTL